MGGEARPLRSLTSVWWWVALAALLLNDHFLKGADLLPGWFTGKASDFAGLLVAPALLAALVRVRTRRGLLLSHLAVGAVFAAINVSGAFAALFEGATAVTPFPWAITVDPTDLVALPMIGLSWLLSTGPTPRPAPSPTVVPARPLRAAALLVGGLACMATSPPPPEVVYPDWPNAQLVIANDSGADVTVRIRPLKASVRLDCAVVAEDPAYTLSRALFERAETWLVEPERTIPLGESPVIDAAGQRCHAYLVDGSGIPMTLFFWMDGEYLQTSIPSHTADLAGRGLDNRSIHFDGVRLSVHETTYLAPQPLEPPLESVCSMNDGPGLVNWSQPAPSGDWSLVALAETPDGCYALDLGHTPDATETRRWYVCAPGVPFPFAPGDSFHVDSVHEGLNWAGMEGVELLSTDARLVLGRGGDVVRFGDSAATYVGIEGCGAYRDDCGGLIEPVAVALPGHDPIAPGQTLLLGERDTLHIAWAGRQPIADTACAGTAGVWEFNVESVWAVQPPVLPDPPEAAPGEADTDGEEDAE